MLLLQATEDRTWDCFVLVSLSIFWSPRKRKKGGNGIKGKISSNLLVDFFSILIFSFTLDVFLSKEGESWKWYWRKSDPNIPFIFYIQRKFASAECFFRDIFACILYFQKYYQHCHSHSLSGIARVLLLISIFIKAYFTPAKSFLQPFLLLIFSLSFIPLFNFSLPNFSSSSYSFASLLPPQSFDQRARVFLLLVTCVQRLWLVCSNN